MSQQLFISNVCVHYGYDHIQMTWGLSNKYTSLLLLSRLYKYGRAVLETTMVSSNGRDPMWLMVIQLISREALVICQDIHDCHQIPILCVSTLPMCCHNLNQSTYVVEKSHEHFDHKHCNLYLLITDHPFQIKKHRNIYFGKSFFHSCVLIAP